MLSREREEPTSRGSRVSRPFRPAVFSYFHPSFSFPRHISEGSLFSRPTLPHAALCLSILASADIRSLVPTRRYTYDPRTYLRE